MSELEELLIGDGAAASPAVILRAVPGDLMHKKIPGSPHTIYQELWHIVFWLEMSLDWIEGRETPYLEDLTKGFATGEHAARESWAQLCERFFREMEKAAVIAGDTKMLERIIRCPSPPGKPTRKMTVREQLESLAAHNAYHFGRIVLLRQLFSAWPPLDEHVG